MMMSPPGYDEGAEPPVPSFVMDLRETTRPVLHPLVEQLLADERLAAYAEALPAPARVSEPALPLLLAALHEQLDRGLVALLPEDADARDAAEGARGLRPRAAAAPGRRAGPRARRARGGRARVRLRGGARRAAPASGVPARAD